MCARSSSVRSSFFVCSSVTMRRPEAWPVDSPPPSFCPTDVDSSVSSHRSSSAAVMLTASPKSRRTSSASSCGIAAPWVSTHPAGYLDRVLGKRGGWPASADLGAAEQTAEARGESVHQVLDRNLGELLQELRVAITGVQILFA